MQNTTTAARRGIQLNKQEFRKAIEKAEAVKPRVVHIGAHYGVQQSDQKSFAQVTFIIYDNRLFATCTCYAHTRGHNNSGKPTPCYHIAAAALSRDAAKQAASNLHESKEINYYVCENSPMCAPGLCSPRCQNASDLAEEAARHFTNPRTELEAEITRLWTARYPANSDGLLRRALLTRFGVSTLAALPVGTLNQIHTVL